MKKITKNITNVDILMATGFPGGINFPQNVPCPNRCKFCYEHSTDKLFPWVTVKYIKPFTEKNFVSYLKRSIYISELKKKQMGENMGMLSHIVHYKNDFLFVPKCDFFSLGLTPHQIELILKNGKPLKAYTTGLNVDPELIEFFTKKYPNKFSVHLSIVTFDPIIRKDLMNPRINLSHLKKISKIAKNSDYFLLFFNKRQLISDISFLNYYSIRNNNSIEISNLFYSKVSPQIVREYAQQADSEFESAINYIRENKGALCDSKVSRVTFYPDSQIFSWSRRKRMQSLFKYCEDTKNSAVFCSRGAFNIIRSLFRQANIIPVESCYGGNIDFVLGMTVKQIIVKINDLMHKGITLKYVYLPDKMFSISNKFDLNRDTTECLKKAFPSIGIFIIQVPAYFIDGGVTFKECVDYYLDKSYKHNMC